MGKIWVPKFQTMKNIFSNWQLLYGVSTVYIILCGLVCNYLGIKNNKIMAYMDVANPLAIYLGTFFYVQPHQKKVTGHLETCSMIIIIRYLKFYISLLSKHCEH